MISLSQACVDFYAMQVIDIEHNKEGAKYKKFVKFKSQFTKQLAKSMEDYLVLACAGEMRHGKHKCDMCYSTFPVGGSRSNVWGDIVSFNPQQIMNMAANLFQNYRWEGGYGGKKWGQCAQAYIDRYTDGHIMQKDTVFVDHCFDLQHNNGTVFNKGCDIFKETSIGYLLDTKRDHVEAIFNSFAVSPIIVYFMCELGVEYAGTFVPGNKNIDKVMNYKGIKWGTLEMSEEMQDGRCYAEDESDEDDEDDEETEETEEDSEPSCGSGSSYSSYSYNASSYHPINVRVSSNSISVIAPSVVGETDHDKGKSGYNRTEYLASLSERIIR